MTGIRVLMSLLIFSTIVDTPPGENEQGNVKSGTGAENDDIILFFGKKAIKFAFDFNSERIFDLCRKCSFFVRN